MPNPLNNVTVDNDQYDDARTVRFQFPQERAFVQVFNASVYVQVERCEPEQRAGSGNYLPEEQWFPGVTQISRGYLIGSIRFRRQLPTNPTDPQVTAR